MNMMFAEKVTKGVKVNDEQQGPQNRALGDT